MKKKEKNTNEKIFPELPEVKERKKISYIVTFIFIFIFLYTNVLYGFIINKLKIQLDINQNDIISIVMDIISVIILYCVLKETLKRDIKYYFKNFKQYFKYGICFLFVFEMIILIVTGCISLVVGNTSNNEIELDKLQDWSLRIQAIMLAPFIEECMFRGLIKKIIKNKYIFLIISSVFFGAMHVILVSTPTEPLQYLYIISYSISGFALAYNYEKTGNLISSIVIHMISNSIAILL